MRVVINAGHTKIGVGTGANGYLNESKETRVLAYEIMKQLAATGHEVIPAVYDKSSNNLQEAVGLANQKGADLFLSIHLNAGNGQGSEAYTWKGQKVAQAVNVLHELNKLGFRYRGVKDGSNYYVIKKTKCTAILVEVCFTDNKEDADLYKKLGAEKVAAAIVRGLF